MSPRTKNNCLGWLLQFFGVIIIDFFFESSFFVYKVNVILSALLDSSNCCTKDGEGFACASRTFYQTMLPLFNALNNTFHDVNLAWVRLCEREKYLNVIDLDQSFGKRPIVPNQTFPSIIVGYFTKFGLWLC